MYIFTAPKISRESRRIDFSQRKFLNRQYGTTSKRERVRLMVWNIYICIELQCSCIDYSVRRQFHDQSVVDHSSTRPESVSQFILQRTEYAPNAKKLRTLPQIDVRLYQDYMDDYDTIMHIEPASGVTVKAHGRLGASFSVFCVPDPLSGSCLLFEQEFQVLRQELRQVRFFKTRLCTAVQTF